jgi:hypothetical protein
MLLQYGVPVGRIYFPLHLLLLTISHCKVILECIPSLLCRKSAIPIAAITVEDSSCKDLGIRILELICLTDGDSS